MRKRIILVTILTLIVIVGGVGIGLAWKTDVLDKVLPPNIKEMFGRGEKPEEEEEKPKPLKETFQQILEKNCKKIGNESSYFYGIDPDNLPISIDPSVITIVLREKGTVVCAGPDTPGHGYVFIEVQEGNVLYLYDKNSEELGHGGPPFLGSYGNIMEEAGDIKLTVYLQGGHTGPGFEVGIIPVVARGEKRLRLSNGETIFVNTERTVIKADDPRLVNFLNQNSVEFDLGGGEITRIYEGTDKEMVGRFFSDMAALESPEKEKIDEIKRVLNAITAK